MITPRKETEELRVQNERMAKTIYTLEQYHFKLSEQYKILNLKLEKEPSLPNSELEKVHKILK